MIAADKAKQVFISIFTIASFHQSSTNGFGQTGILLGLRVEIFEGIHTFHTIHWTSRKQRGVSYSPYGSEVLACDDKYDREHYFKAYLKSHFLAIVICNELFSDCHCLLDTIATLHEERDYRLRPMVLQIKNSFDSCGLDLMM